MNATRSEANVRRIHAAGCAAAAGFALFGAATSSATVVDDFEVGDFECIPVGLCSELNVNLPTGVHTMTDARGTHLAVDGGSAVLQTAILRDDGVRLVFEGWNEYRQTMSSQFSGTVDLTDGGTSDRFYLRFDEVTTPLTVWLSANVFGNYNVFAPSLLVSAPGTYAVPFSSFSSPNDEFDRVHRVEVRITATDGFACLSDWRSGRPGFEIVPWTGNAGTQIDYGPLLPIQWIGNEGGPLISSSSLTVMDAQTFGTPLLIEVSHASQNACGSGARTLAAIDLRLIDGGFDEVSIRLRIVPQALPVSSLVGDGPASLVEAEHAASVAIPFRRLGTGGSLEGVLRQTLRFDAGDSETMDLFVESVTLGLPGNATAYEVVVRVVGAEEQLPGGSPIVSMTLEETLAPNGGPATEVPSGDGIRSVGLWGRPSTFRESTRFELSEPLTRNELLRVYDVRGRIVRRLPVAAGHRGTTWDGRDDAGSRVGVGVYFARIETPETRTARVIVVR
jgi:hypothetical protein